MRALAVAALKRSVHSLSARPGGAKLIRLIAEEWAVGQAAVASRHAGAALRATLAPIVLRGPFAGLRYPQHGAVGSSYWPKLLGAYEAELAPAMEVAVARGYSHILDIGAAEGYYAVGLARRLPDAQVIAYEGSAAGRAMLREMASANDVADRVTVAGWCDAAALAALAPTLPAGRTLVICDAEAAEYDLLDPAARPELAGCDLVIELHRRQGVADPRAWALAQFTATHAVAFVDPAPRDPAAYPELEAVAPEHRPGVLFERTDPFGWAVCTARAADPSRAS